ncbi:hypothetical protein ABZZ20_00640 [Streptomyces sp. NPDC006430]
MSSAYLGLPAERTTAHLERSRAGLEGLPDPETAWHVLARRRGRRATL